VTFFDQIAGGAALGAAMLVGLSVAQAGYVVDLTQQGGNVVASGSGAIDLTDLIDQGSAEDRGALVPKTATIITGTVRNLVCGAIMTPMEGAYGNQERHPGRFTGGA
jgi:hypothetical protein